MTYLLNTWYAAAFSREVADRPLARKLLDLPLVFFRGADGAVGALLDRCPHRFAPLSRGKVQGNDLECGYHGLRFSSAGACVLNPHGDGKPPRQALVRSFPVHERYGLVWCWLGDPDLADAGRLPTFDFLESPGRFATVSGYLHVDANYQLVVDNLLDLSHASFLHPGFATPGRQPDENLRAAELETVQEGDTLLVKRVRRNYPPNRPSRELFGVTAERVDSRSNIRWFPPSLLHLDLGVTEPGAPEADGLSIPGAHFITPETELTSHYFHLQARNRFLDDERVAEAHFKLTDDAFRYEDEPMIEAQQRSMGATSDLMSLKPVLLGVDAAPVRARRLLAKLIDAERAVQVSS